MNKGERLVYLREKKSKSQTEAARYLGISKQSLYKYEKNIVTNIPSDVVERMATYYNTTPQFIMGWEDEQGEKTPHGQLVDAYVNMDRQEKANALYDQYESLPPEKQAQFDNFLKFLQSDTGLPRLH